MIAALTMSSRHCTSAAGAKDDSLGLQSHVDFRRSTVNSRREFLTRAPLALAGIAVASYAQDQQPSNGQAQNQQQQPPGAPPAFGTSPAVGPEVSTATFAQAEKLVQVDYTQQELAQCAGNWRMAMAPLYEMRVGPHKAELEDSLAPATLWDPLIPGAKPGPSQNRFVVGKADPGPLPSNDEDIAFASVAQLSGWIQQRKITSERLTNIYLERLREVRSQAALRHHADRRPRAAAGQAS